MFKLAILFILMIRIETIQMTTNSTEKDKICESLQRSDGSKFNILAVGKTKKRLLLITADFYVYDVPLDSMNSTIDKLYLGSKPLHMEQKYPVLYHSPSFQRIKHLIFNAWIMTDPDSDWICITVRTSSLENGVNYDIDHSQPIPGWSFDGSLTTSQVLISTSQPCQYYSLTTTDYHQSLQINRFQCVESDRVRETPKISPINADAIICYDQTKTKITVEMIPWGQQAKCRSGIPVTWPVLKGFVSAGKFYLFGESHIYIFDENVYNEPGQSYPVEKHSYDSFFNCPGIIPSSNVVFKSYFYWIIAAIIVLLVILSILIWCILVTRRRHRTHRSLIAEPTGRSGQISKQNLSKLSLNVATTRSNCKSMTQKMNCEPVMVGSRSALSARSGNLTVRTEVDSNVHQLKRLSTRIQSSRRGSMSRFH
uniref:Uncharacterized protein LOC113796330 isoform X3 n=1 Tax=Dermatophagoides pteronyssinus TaxID=6956 RepID=A0A6P6YA97_DERPT|nr:uncharacterized protein LOC113796330 isoform X3 [Dermatophagoides pteronyssinus]